MKNNDSNKRKNKTVEIISVYGLRGLKKYLVEELFCKPKYRANIFPPPPPFFVSSFFFFFLLLSQSLLLAIRISLPFLPVNLNFHREGVATLTLPFSGVIIFRIASDVLFKLR